MGNNNSDMTEAEFRQKWKLTDSVGSISIWENKENPDQKVEQYHVRNNQKDFNEKLYQLRRNNPFLVNAYTLRREGFSCQVDHDDRSIFVERIPLRLSNVENIPYPDVFHLYDSCINGYSQLANAVGFFSIDEDQIGINEKGKVKVWLNNLYQESEVRGARVTEPVMVRELLNILQANTDQQSRGKYPDLAWYIGNHENITFNEVNHKFIQYIRQYTKGELPLFLNCVFEHGGSGIIENWCRTNKSYGYDEGSLRERQELYRNRVVGAPPTGIVSPKTTTIPVAAQLNPTISRPETVNLPIVSGQQQFIGQRIQAPQNPFVITSNIPPQPLVQQRRIELGGPVQSINPPPVRLEERVISEKIIDGAPFLQQQQPPVGHSIRINTGSPVPPGPAPVYARQIPVSNAPGPERIAVPPPRVLVNDPRIMIPMSPIPEQSFPSNPPSVTSSIKMERQTSVPTPILQLQNQVSSGVPQENQRVNYIPQQILTNPPQVTESINFTRPAQRTTTSKILENLQGNAVVENKGDLVTSVPSGFGQNRLQQQRVISQTIELKDESSTTVIPQPPSYKANVPVATQDFTKKTETYTYDAGLTDYGRAVPYSFNVEEERKFQTKFEAPSKFVPSEDGKSSPDFLAFLNEIKAGSTSKLSSEQVLSYGSHTATPSGFQNQQLVSGGISNLAGVESYSREASAAQVGISNYQTSSYQYKPEEFKFSSGDYNLAKYEANIDPDLHADILKFKQ